MTITNMIRSCQAVCFALVIMVPLVSSPVAMASQHALPGAASRASAMGDPHWPEDKLLQALKDWLSICARNAGQVLSKPDAYLRNAAIKILLPPEVAHVETTLRSLGLGSLADNVIVTMNRAAEQAAAQAPAILLSAIQKLTAHDVITIVKGGNDAATQYFKKHTQSQLITSYKPIIEQSLKKTHATRYWKDFFSRYNKLPGVKKVNPDLSSYVTQKALDGLFYQIAQEEASIRKNPEGYLTESIRKLLGL